MTGSKIILLIDDEPAIRFILRDRLEYLGFQVWEAENGNEAVELCLHEKPDLILLDILMPQMNGYQLWSHFQKDPELAKIPYLILTAKPRSQDTYWKGRIMKEDFITKPYEFETLLERIRQKLD